MATVRAEKKERREVYVTHAVEASKPIADRKPLVSGRGGKLQSPRRHHLTVAAQKALLVRISETGRFVSPHKEYCVYWGIVEALVQLGENKSHLLGDVLRRFEEIMSQGKVKRSNKTAWESFRQKGPRTRDNSLDFFGRFRQDICVLQRIGGAHPYGLKLAQLGGCIDLLKGEKGAPLIRLRTGIPKGQPVTPLNELKERVCERTVDHIPSQIVFDESADKSSGSVPLLVSA